MGWREAHCPERKSPVRRRQSSIKEMQTATIADRKKLVRASSDPSAYVRLDLAQQMGQRKWPEAEASLAVLVRDERDFYGPARLHRLLLATVPGRTNCSSLVWPLR